MRETKTRWNMVGIATKNIVSIPINLIAAHIHLNVSALCVYLLSELQADPPHISFLGAPTWNQSDNLLLRSKGTVLRAAFCLAALLWQRNLLLTQEVGISTSRGNDLKGRDGGGGWCFIWLLIDRSTTKENCFWEELTISSSCLAVICSVTLNTAKGSGPGAPYTVTLCCRDARFSSELNSWQRIRCYHHSRDIQVFVVDLYGWRLSQCGFIHYLFFLKFDKFPKNPSKMLLECKS